MRLPGSKTTALRSAATSVNETIAVVLSWPDQSCVSVPQTYAFEYSATACSVPAEFVISAWSLASRVWRLPRVDGDHS